MSVTDNTSMTRSEKILHALAIRNAPAWLPQPGDTLKGFLVGTREQTSDYGSHTVYVFRDEDEPQDLVAVHAFHTLLRDSLEANPPEVGEWRCISYDGKRKVDSDQPYHAYTVLTENDL